MDKFVCGENQIPSLRHKEVDLPLHFLSKH